MMKTYTLMASAVFAVTAMATGVADAQQSPQTPPSSSDRSTMGSAAQRGITASDQARSKLNSADKTFLDDAHASGQKEIQEARLAMQHSTETKVRELAASLEREHIALNSRLAAAGAQSAAGSPSSHGAAERTPVDSANNDAAAQAADGSQHYSPSSPARAHSQAASGSNNPAGATAVLAADPHMKGLVETQGTDFDSAYIDMVVEMHAQSIAKYEAAANDDGHSPSVRSLAQQALPNLRRHAQMAESLSD